MTYEQALKLQLDDIVFLTDVHNKTEYSRVRIGTFYRIRKHWGCLPDEQVVHKGHNVLFIALSYMNGTPVNIAVYPENLILVTNKNFETYQILYGEVNVAAK